MIEFFRCLSLSLLFLSAKNAQFSSKPCSSPYWGVAKGSSVSWVAKLKGDKKSERKLSNGWSRSSREIKPLLSAGNEWSRSYREIDQHPSLPWNFITHGFLDPSAFPDLFSQTHVSFSKRNLKSMSFLAFRQIDKEKMVRVLLNMHTFT